MDIGKAFGSHGGPGYMAYVSSGSSFWAEAARNVTDPSINVPLVSEA